MGMLVVLGLLCSTQAILRVPLNRETAGLFKRSCQPTCARAASSLSTDYRSQTAARPAPRLTMCWWHLSVSRLLQQAPGQSHLYSPALGALSSIQAALHLHTNLCRAPACMHAAHGSCT
jgi:hypothetical protein